MPLGKARRRSHGKQIDHSSPLEIHEHGPVPLLLPPCPVVYAQDPRVPFLGMARVRLHPPEYRISAGDHSHLLQQTRSRQSAQNITDSPQRLGKSIRFSCLRGGDPRAIAPQRSCVDNADCDSEGDESSPGPAPAAPARADRASGEHRSCDKKLPISNSSDIEAFPDFEPGKQYPVRSAPRRPIPATLARATTSAQYQWVGSQPQHSKLVKPAPKVRKNLN